MDSKRTSRQAHIASSLREQRVSDNSSTPRRDGRPDTTKKARRDAAEGLPTHKPAPPGTPPSVASSNTASSGASANGSGNSSTRVRQARATAASATMAERKRAFYPKEVTLTRLLSELDERRIAFDRRPLKPWQRLRLEMAWEHHRRSPITTPDRYRPLYDRIKATKAQDSGRLKLASVLARMEKANDEPYTTGERAHKRVNYNAQVDDRSGRPIVCADHAGARAEDALVSKEGKSGAHAYATPEGIHARLGDAKGLTRFYHLKSTAPIKAVIDCRDFGDFSKKQFSEMVRESKGGDRIRAGVIVIGDHAVPVRLKMKNAGGRPRFALDVGDFNRGNGDRRLQKAGPSRFAGYGLNSFLVPAATTYATYVRGGSETCAIYLHDAAVPSWKQGKPASAPRYTIDIELTSQTLNHLCDGNFPFEPDWVCAQLEDRTPEEVSTILKAVNPAGLSGMFSALQSGSALAIERFGKALLAILDDPRHESLQSQVAGLVSSRCQGQNGLHTALAFGKADAIRAYADLLLELHARNFLADEELAALLACEYNNGKAGLLAAVQQGREKAIDSYLEAIARVPAAHRVAPLSLTAEGGDRVIADAMESGEDELARDLFAVLRKAGQKGVITLRQLAELSTSADLASVAVDRGGPPRVHRVHAAHVLEMIECAGGRDHSLDHLRDRLTSITMS